MGALAVVITLVAYGIYVWQTLRGEARPHPLSWLIFGILTGTAYLVQVDRSRRRRQLGHGHHRGRLCLAVRDELLARRAGVSVVRVGVPRSPLP